MQSPCAQLIVMLGLHCTRQVGRFDETAHGVLVAQPGDSGDTGRWGTIISIGGAPVCRVRAAKHGSRCMVSGRLVVSLTITTTTESSGGSTSAISSLGSKIAISPKK